jgi:hypothetical protein
MPLKILTVFGTLNVPAEYKHAFVMVRSDAHTVWRGHELTPGSAQQLVAALCGLSPQVQVMSA